MSHGTNPSHYKSDLDFTSQMSSLRTLTKQKMTQQAKVLVPGEHHGAACAPLPAVISVPLPANGSTAKSNQVSCDEGKCLAGTKYHPVD